MKRIAIVGLLLLSLVALNGCFLNNLTAQLSAEKFWTGLRDSVSEPLEAVLADSVTFVDDTDYVTSEPYSTRDEIIALISNKSYWWGQLEAPKSMKTEVTYSGDDMTVMTMDVFWGVNSTTQEPNHYIKFELVFDANLLSPKITHIRLQALGE